MVERDEFGLPVRRSDHVKPRPVSLNCRQSPALGARRDAQHRPVSMSQAVVSMSPHAIQQPDRTNYALLQLARPKPYHRVSSESDLPEEHPSEFELTSVYPPTPLSVTKSDSTRSVQSEHRRSMRKHIQRAERMATKSGFGHEVTCVDTSNENAVVMFLLSRRGTNGHILSNYYHFVCNNHPLLSICFANSRHPFKRKERCVIFICLLSLAFFLSVIILQEYYFTEHGNSTLPSNATIVCEGGVNDGLELEKYNAKCDYYHPWLLSAICGAILVPYGSLLKFLATCGCVQGRPFFQNHCIGSRCRRVLEFFGGKVLSFFELLSVQLCIYAIYQCFLIDRYTILKTTFLSKMWSFAEWFVWTAPYFAFKYPLDRRHFYKQLKVRNRSLNEAQRSPSNQQLVDNTNNSSERV